VKIMANAILSAILSFIIPGLGQVINGEIPRGIILFVLAVIMGLIATFIFQSWIVYIIDFVISVYAAYDAYMIAK